MKLRPLLLSRILAGTLSLSIICATAGCTAGVRKARYLRQAENYYKGGDYEKAKIEYLNVLQVDPQNVVAIQRLGLIWFDQGVPLRAFPYLLGSRQLSPDDLDARTKLGLAYLSVGEPAEARKEALFVLEKDPRRGEAALLLADTTANRDELAANEQTLRRLPDQNSASVFEAKASLAMRTNGLITAQNDLERARAADPRSPSAHLGLAMLATLRKDNDKAEQELKTAVSLAPPRSVARIKYADFKMRAGAIKEAKAFLAETTRLAPDYLPAWQMQASIASLEKDYDASQTLLGHIFSADPDNLDARLLSAENLTAKGDYDQAASTLERLDNLFKSSPLIKVRLARAYLQNNNRTQAVVALTQAVATAPNYADAVLLLGELDISGGQPQAAVDSLTDLLRKRPDLLDGRVLLANAYRALGRLDDAEETLNRLTNDAPRNPQVYLLLGMVQRQQNKLAEARASFAKADELAPGDLSVLFQSVDLDIQQKDTDAAHEKVRLQLQKTPGSAPTHFLESRVYAAQQDWAHAESSLLKALELDPNFSSAYDLLISTYVSANKLAPALGQLDSLLAKNPNNPRALMMSALIYSKQKDVDKARASYEKLLASSPNFTAALNNLAYIYSENFNQLDKAYDLARRARNLLPNDASVADTLAWILYKRADYQQALRLAQEAAAKLPGEPEVQYHLAMASYMMGQVDAARAAFQKAAGSPVDFPGKAEVPGRLAALAAGGQDAGPALSATDLEAAVKSNPADLIATLRLADAYEKQQAWDKARDVYQQALGVNAQLLPALDHLARLYSGPLHDPAKALGYAKTARELAPGDPRARALLGQLNYQNGNFIQAYALLRDSARDLPDDLGVRRDFALAAYHLGNVEEARQGMQGVVAAADKDPQTKRDAQRFLTLTKPDPTPQALAALEPEAQQTLQADPGDVPASMIRAGIQTQRGETQPAVDIYVGILQRAPDFTPAQKRLAALYLLNPDTRDKAYDLAVKARKSAPNDPGVAESLAAANYYRREYAYATQLLQESARQRPLAAEPLYYLGMCYLQTRQLDLGRENLTKAMAAGLSEPLAAEAKRALAAMPLHP